MSERGKEHSAWIVVIAIVALIIGAVYAAWTSQPAPEPTPTFTDMQLPMLPPCETEDSNNCYWDADTMGNGEGHDSIVVEGGN